MKLISLKAVVELILSNKAKHISERIDADDVCDFERMKRIESRMDEDDDIGNKVSELPSAFEGMTNGELMKAIFESDNVQFDETGSWIHIIINGMDYSFCPVEFWNAPYQKGGKT